MLLFLPINFIYILLNIIIMELSNFLPTTNREILMEKISRQDDKGKQILSAIIGDWMLNEDPLFGKYLILNYAKSSNYVDFFIEALKHRMLESGAYNNWDKFFEILEDLKEPWQIRTLTSVLAAMPKTAQEQAYWAERKADNGMFSPDEPENEFVRCFLLLKSLPATDVLRAALEEKAKENLLIAEVLKEKF